MIPVPPLFNPGTGRGSSVLEIVRVFESSNGQRIPYKVMSRRPGDIATCYANVNKAAKTLKWVAKRNLFDMCKSAWRYQMKSATAYFIKNPTLRLHPVVWVGNTQRRNCE